MEICEDRLAADHAPERFRWDRLTVVGAIAYCVMSAAISIGMILGELRDELGLSGAVTALHGSAFGIGMLLNGMFGNQVITRFGRPRMFWLSLTAVPIGIGFVSLGRSLAMTLPGSVIAGFAAAVVVMVMPGFIADHHPRHRSEAFNAVNAYPVLWGLVTALLVGGVIRAGWSWRVAFLGAALLIFAALVIAGFRQPIPEAPTETAGSAMLALRDPGVRRAWRDLTLSIMVEFPAAVWATVYLKEVGGASAAAAPVLSSLFGLAMFTSRIALPRIGPLFGERLREVSLCATGSAALALFLLPSLAGKVLAIACIGFAAGPLYNSSIDRLYLAGVGLDSQTVGALAALASGVAVSTAPLALGILADVTGLRMAILIVPTIAAAALLIRCRDGRQR